MMKAIDHRRSDQGAMDCQYKDIPDAERNSWTA